MGKIPLEWFLEPNEKDTSKKQEFHIRQLAEKGKLPEWGYFVFKV